VQVFLEYGKGVQVVNLPSFIIMLRRSNVFLFSVKQQSRHLFYEAFVSM